MTDCETEVAGDWSNLSTEEKLDFRGLKGEQK